MLAKHALSQLSYGPFQGKARTPEPPRLIRTRPGRKPRQMVGLGRLELPTSRLSSARSNQLSYKPQAQARSSSKAVLSQNVRSFTRPRRLRLARARNIRPNTGKAARARPGRKRNEGGKSRKFGLTAICSK